MFTADRAATIHVLSGASQAPRCAGRLALRAGRAVLLMPLGLVLLPLLPCVLLMHAVKKLHEWQDGSWEAGSARIGF